MAAARAPAARCLTILVILAVLLGHPGQALGLQRAGAAAVNLPSYEELASSLLVNQLTLLQLMQDASTASSCMAEREAMWKGEASARDARLQEMGKVMEDFKSIVENVTQETLTVVTALRQELTSLRQEIQQLQDGLLEKTTSLPSEERDVLPAPTACPDGWLRHESSCYLIDETHRTWEENLAYCRSLGGDLVKIKSAGEQEFIKSHLGASCCYWIGLNDRENEGQFVWTDGSTPTYTAWGKWDPNDYGGKEDCAGIRNSRGYDWLDFPCNEPDGRWKVACMCERPVHA